MTNNNGGGPDLYQSLKQQVLTNTQASNFTTKDSVELKPQTSLSEMGFRKRKLVKHSNSNS